MHPDGFPFNLSGIFFAYSKIKAQGLTIEQGQSLYNPQCSILNPGVVIKLKRVPPR